MGNKILFWIYFANVVMWIIVGILDIAVGRDFFTTSMRAFLLALSFISMMCYNKWVIK